MKKPGENSLEVASLLSPKNIDPANYFLSLTGAAAEAGLLAQGEFISMEAQIHDILADVVWMYNNGTSTSVTEELATEFIESILFTLDCFCIAEGKYGSAADNEVILDMLREKAGIKKCYEKGTAYIDMIWQQAKNTYNDIYISNPNVNSGFYKEIFNETLPRILKSYQKYFFAHHTGIDIFYPPELAKQLRKYKGILYINEYLKYVKLRLNLIQ